MQRQFPTPDEIAAIVTSAKDAAYSVERVSEMVVITAHSREGILAGALRLGGEGFSVMHEPFERDPGVYAVTLYKPAP